MLRINSESFPKKYVSGRLLHLHEADSRPSTKTIDRENWRIKALLSDKMSSKSSGS